MCSHNKNSLERISARSNLNSVHKIATTTTRWVMQLIPFSSQRTLDCDMVNWIYSFQVSRLCNYICFICLYNKFTFVDAKQTTFLDWYFLPFCCALTINFNAVQYTSITITHSSTHAHVGVDYLIVNSIWVNNLWVV